ncbi:hypothetical protein E2C01_052059 [Portunus trituberculatus]|uniref:Uncharacterized protein n=1 Tax=Portunus trituberculatus TaxID=210409 RepID=A0A5B7GND8_PORTR|nr:hypothetical protein [Portunus trituberculatus]
MHSPLSKYKYRTMNQRTTRLALAPLTYAILLSLSSEFEQGKSGHRFDVRTEFTSKPIGSGKLTKPPALSDTHMFWWLVQGPRHRAIKTEPGHGASLAYHPSRHDAGLKM